MIVKIVILSLVLEAVIAAVLYQVLASRYKFAGIVVIHTIMPNDKDSGCYRQTVFAWVNGLGRIYFCNSYFDRLNNAWHISEINEYPDLNNVNTMRNLKYHKPKRPGWLMPKSLRGYLHQGYIVASWVTDQLHNGPVSKVNHLSWKYCAGHTS